MKLPFLPVVILQLFFLTLSHPVCAAEIANIRTHFSSTQLTIEYDLLGKSGEKDSSVEVVLEIKGTRYHSHMLSLSGDFGRSITLGKKRLITWRHPQDFPEGLDTTFKCIVNAIPNSSVGNEGVTPSEGFKNSYFAVNKQTVVETRTRLMWTRNANLPIKPMKQKDAQNVIGKLNRERYAGYNDWRVPTQEDIEGLVFFGKKAGWGTIFGHFIADYLADCGFTAVQSGNYWTATSVESVPERFYVANTWNGNIRPLAGDNYYYLWPVRSIQ